MNSIQSMIASGTTSKKSSFKYILGGKPFRTWADVTKHSQAILAKGCRALNTEETAFAKDLFTYHPYANEKLSGGIRSISVNTPAFGTGYCFVIEDEKGNRQDISHKKCRPLTKKDPVKAVQSYKRENKFKAYRQAISDDVYQFMMGNCLKTCNCCNTEFYLVVDHVKPFVQIVNEFEQVYPIDNSVEIVKNSDNNIYPYVFTDVKLKEAWKKFHSENANYQILCDSCNSRKNSSGIRHHSIV